jgi:hypothetical protein
MNYNMQGMTKMIPKIFTMLKSAKVEIKKLHQVLMVDKITSRNNIVDNSSLFNFRSTRTWYQF